MSWPVLTNIRWGHTKTQKSSVWILVQLEQIRTIPPKKKKTPYTQSSNAITTISFWKPISSFLRNFYFVHDKLPLTSVKLHYDTLIGSTPTLLSPHPHTWVHKTQFSFFPHYQLFPPHLPSLIFLQQHPISNLVPT